MKRTELLQKYLRQERQTIHETSADYEHKNPKTGLVYAKMRNSLICSSCFFILISPFCSPWGCPLSGAGGLCCQFFCFCFDGFGAVFGSDFIHCHFASASYCVGFGSPVPHFFSGCPVETCFFQFLFVFVCVAGYPYPRAAKLNNDTGKADEG